ncbi:virulence factor SrfB [Polynucleobacter rarus]|uniref:virulence factor SrfB n=1 Tax=Polynucleobacter rarus TaxID=556055 RepID=UPI000D3E2F15|nr:virulence factor SrfB [Polynucleobacter rarus]
MLVKLQNFDAQVSLIENSGIQFLDFGFCKNSKQLKEANFLDSDNEQVPILLIQDHQGNLSKHGLSKERYLGSPKYFSSGSETLKFFDSIWVPFPFFQQKNDGSFINGPTNWVRSRLKILNEPDEDGNLYRLTLAFDTNLNSFSFSENDYLTPKNEDIENGNIFAALSDITVLDEFLIQKWVHSWITKEWDIFIKKNNPKLSAQEIEEQKLDWPTEAIGKYKHFVSLVSEMIKFPRVKILENTQSSGKSQIETSLILDLGNSRTCAVLLEKHPAQRGNLSNSYTLQLRDLGDPHLVYSEPFESRIEFNLAEFGSSAISRESGRQDGFLWPTFARVGPEASRLSTRRRGTEGTTGLSGPKRYLWDEEEFPLDWRFNQPQSLIEPLANEGIFVRLINQKGDALCNMEIDDPGRFPVINPRYSRSSLMTFAISEILTQSLVMINSHAQRMKMPNYDLVRHLSKIVLTLPPAMPLQEQAILRKRALEACKLVWQALEYLNDDGDKLDVNKPNLPEVVIRYDEATCSQVVWLYSSINSQFGGSAPSMFAANKRLFGDSNIRKENELRVASIDIGGGTTDLVIADYVLEGKGSVVTIVPNQIFREGFTIAGDDILKRVIQLHVITEIENEIRNSGISDPTAITKDLFGADRANQDIQVKTLRRQFTNQILVPIGLNLLGEYENIEKIANVEPIRKNIQEFLQNSISPKVVKYINDAVHSAGGHSFDIMKINFLIDLNAIDQTIQNGTEINRVLEALCEVVYAHNCDLLLLTGRPSRFKGIITTVKKNMPLPVERIIQMHGFRCGTWYPFHEYGTIGDPKTTAAVGAMLCTLSEGGIANFLFSSEKLNLKSTTKFIGKITDGQIANADIFYNNVNLDDPNYELSEDKFEFRGGMWIGFRQLPLERWRASLIYFLDYADEETRKKIHPQTPLLVSLKRDKGQIRKGDHERFEIGEISSKDGVPISRKSLKIQLQTLSDDLGYWLDSGHIKEA